jgi:RNA polymerase sigma factor (sigma-70 family)
MIPEKQTLSLKDRSDGDLLHQYVAMRSDAAFAELGRRYAGLVYATCLREIGDRTLAEDVAQDVLLLMSRKANTLQRHETLAGWLYSAARYLSKNLLKQERRRQMNEARAAESTIAASDTGNRLWERIEPHLHEALDHLKPADREAVLLRFVAEQSFAEVGSRLGLSENTARMRVNRALDRLRVYLRKAGIVVSVGLLAPLMEERAAQAAPARLLQFLPHRAVGHDAPASLHSSRLPAWCVPPRSSAFRLRRNAALNSVLILLAGFTIYRRILPQRLNMTEQQQLFARLSGVWKGTLEYADDRTLQHFTYPTTVTFRIQNQGGRLEFTADYKGSANVDTTTLNSAPDTGRISVTNGGPQSSHRLNGVGELVRMPDGGYAFVGESTAMNADVRLVIRPAGRQLLLQEEYRKSGQERYQFRNRFTLSRL